MIRTKIEQYKRVLKTPLPLKHYYKKVKDIKEIGNNLNLICFSHLFFPNVILGDATIKGQLR